MIRIAFTLAVVACGGPKNPRVAAPAAEPPRTERGAPAELVAELEPLSREKMVLDESQKPQPVVPVVESVKALKREQGGTRVRVANVPHGDRFWRIAFVTSAENPLELGGGECLVADMDRYEIECLTTLSPEELTVDGHARPVRLVPPVTLVRRIDAEIAHWNDPIPARVFKFVAVGNELELSFGFGKEKGLEKTWRVTTGKHECTITNVQKSYATCRTKLTEAELHEDPFVTISRPE